jgi:hypothetical protein
LSWQTTYEMECLAKKLFHVCFTLKIIDCNEFHSDLISLFQKLDKNIETGNNEWHGASFGDIETESRNLRIPRWNDFLFLITDDRDFRPQTCTTGLVFRECKHIMNIFKDVYFTKTSFYISLTITHVILKYPFTWLAIKTNKTESAPLQI